jgi:rare lipoprotein A
MTRPALTSVRAVALAALALLATACLGTRPRPPGTPGAPALPGPQPPATTIPAPPFAVDAVPDAVPRVEPRSHTGNPAFYDVFGRRYYVLPSSVGYLERGVASWYGPGFHEIRTSIGEPYDMYAMTAAHKTLPLPAYVRVTNLQNGRSVTVRVNDRGPFVANRIIDLSYTAAAKLDMLQHGTAMVEVRAIDATAPAIMAASAPAPGPAAAPAAATGAATATAPATVPASVLAATAPAVTAPPGAGLYVQAGAFASPANAERLASRLRGGGYGNIFVREDVLAGRKLYRVRIGPVPDVPEFDRIVAALGRAGIGDARLALD